MGLLDHKIDLSDAPGDPLTMQVLVAGKLLRFVLSVDGMPKGLWRGDLRDALREEVAIMEGKLRAPVTVKAVPPGAPSPSAVIGVVTCDDPVMAVKEWNHAVLRALRNLSMAHGLPMPKFLATVEAAMPG